MIVREQKKRVICVTQREHATVSKDLYLEFADSLEPVTTAINHHDDGWTEFDESLPVKDGSPVDYRSIPLGDHLSILQRSVNRCEERHAYAGWLVSKHGCSFHEEKSGEAVEKFLRNQSRKRRQLSESIDPGLKKHSRRDFDWLQFADAVSLFVLDPWTKTFEWNRDTPGPAVLTGRNETEFTLETGSLEPRELTLTYDYREVTRGTIESEQTFRDSLSRSEARTGKIALGVTRT